jgi:hypothetical protein
LSTEHDQSIPSKQRRIIAGTTTIRPLPPLLLAELTVVPEQLDHAADLTDVDPLRVPMMSTDTTVPAVEVEFET